MHELLINRDKTRNDQEFTRYEGIVCVIVNQWRRQETIKKLSESAINGSRNKRATWAHTSTTLPHSNPVGVQSQPNILHHSIDMLDDAWWCFSYNSFLDNNDPSPEETDHFIHNNTGIHFLPKNHRRITGQFLAFPPKGLIKWIETAAASYEQ